MKCRHCNSENVPDGAAFCPYCGESVSGEKEPSAQITGTVEIGTQQGGKAAGVLIEEIHEAKIGEARIDDARVTLSSEKEDILIEKLIETISTRFGITLETLKAGEVKVPAEAARSINSVMEEVETKGLPVSPASFYRLGMLAAYAKETENAVRYFRKAILADPEYADAYRAISWLQQARAVQEIDKKNLNSASVMLREAREAASHVSDFESLVQQGYNAKTMAQMAEAQDKEREAIAYYEEAAVTFREVLAKDPENAGALNGLGNVHHARGELDEAIALYTHATAVLPAYAAAWHDLAGAYEARMVTDRDHARDWCRKAREAWSRTFRLAKKDPAFSGEEREKILERIDTLDEFCSEGK